MKQKNTPPKDSFQIRCPKLGHLISFSYCRQENLGLPCPKVLDCWFDYFPVRSFFLHQLSPEDFRNCFESPQKPKLASILEIIEQFKKGDE